MTNGRTGFRAEKKSRSAVREAKIRTFYINAKFNEPEVIGSPGQIGEWCDKLALHASLHPEQAKTWCNVIRTIENENDAAKKSKLTNVLLDEFRDAIDREMPARKIAGRTKSYAMSARNAGDRGLTNNRSTFTHGGGRAH